MLKRCVLCEEAMAAGLNGILKVQESSVKNSWSRYKKA